MERRNPADDRADGMASMLKLLTRQKEVLKRKRDDEEKDEDESGEDYHARVM